MDVSDPDRGGGESVFEFQDSAGDLQDAFDKNLPFALDVAKSAKDPANPVERLGIDVPDFVPATFAVSYGDPQTVEVNAKRELGKVRVRYQINGGASEVGRHDRVEGRRALRRRRRLLPPPARRGLRSAKPGDKVKVWFESLKAGKRSSSFTYDAEVGHRQPRAGPVGRGLHRPAERPGLSEHRGPFYLEQYKAALAANNVPYDVYDVDDWTTRTP